MKMVIPDNTVAASLAGGTTGHPFTPRRSRPSARWLMLAAFCLLIGGFSLRYGLPGLPMAAPLPNVQLHRTGLVIHATSAALALLLAPWQMRSGVLWPLPRSHRILGRLYVLLVAIAGGAGLFIAPSARGGLLSAFGFGTLAVLWLATTGIGLVTILEGAVVKHRRWMTRSIALTFAALTLRIYIPSVEIAGLPFDHSYIAISWLCWVPNLLAAELWLHRQQANGRPGWSYPVAVPGARRDSPTRWARK